MRTWVLAGLMGMAATSAFGAGEPWKAADQPDLKQRIDQAAALQPEDLGEPARSVTNYARTTMPLVPHADGKGWDALVWYYKDYGGPTWLYAVDLGTGAVKKQRFPDAHQIHLAGQTLAPDGKYYIAAPLWGRGGGMDMFIYNPATHTLAARGRIVPDLVGERNDVIVGPDGNLYGAGNYVNPPKAGVYRYDLKTGQVRNYGPVGPSHAPNACWGYYIGVDDTHIYVASGKIPWYLVAVEIETGAEKVLLEAPPTGIIHIHSQFPGAFADVQQVDNGPKKTYWLYHGQAIEKTGETPPWPPKESLLPKAGPPPEVYTGETYPDANGVARLWYRSAEDAAKALPVAPKDAKPEELGWKSVRLEGIETYPLTLHRVVPLPDGTIFGRAFGYLGNFLFDPKTGRSAPLGDGGGETYTYILHDGKLYWSGYPSGPIYVYEPGKPWTVGKDGPPGFTRVDETDPASNPRLLGRTYEENRVKLMRGSAVGADGKIYFGGMGLRDYEGGGLGWLDPKTGQLGGLWRPLSAYRIYWLAAAREGRFIVCCTKTTSDELNNNRKQPEAKLFIWDTEAGKFVREIVPVAGADRTGPVVEVKPGRLLGLTDDPANPGAGILYGVDVESGEVLFRKNVPYAVPFPVGHQTLQCGWTLGPDGCLWTVLGKCLVRIRPDNAEVEPVGRLAPVGFFAFSGKDLYLAGDTRLRRIANVVP